MNLYLLTHSAKGNRFHPDIFTFGGILQGQRIGYVRVSSFDQNPDRQLEQIEVGKVFTDKASGKDTQRPELERLLAFVREGDTVVVHSMDRLARNLDDLRRIVQGLTQRGVRMEFVKEGLTFTGEDSPMANLMSARGNRAGQAARCLPGTKEIAEQRTNCRVETASCGRRPKNLGGP